MCLCVFVCVLVNLMLSLCVDVFVLSSCVSGLWVCAFVCLWVYALVCRVFGFVGLCVCLGLCACVLMRLCVCVFV